MKNYIGVDIGGMSIKAAVITEKGEILSKAVAETKVNQHYSKTVDDIYLLCKEVARLAGLDLEKDISGVGMGCPGTVWTEKGIIKYANNLNFENVPLTEEFGKYSKLPCYADNDANCAALGEALFGGGRGYTNSIFITLGTGVGSGIILNGKVWSGAYGAGGEAGHMVIRTNGEQCTCGRKGCWEAYASATALIRETKKVMENRPDSLMHKVAAEHGKVSGRTAFTAAKMGDTAAKRLVKKYLENIAEGISNLVNIIRPDVVLIGGGISNEGEYFIKRLQKLVDKYNYGGGMNPSVPLKRATLLNDAGVVGAAALAMNKD